jgi:dolichyl-phosphate-mannose-protein mannosyltransferase
MRFWPITLVVISLITHLIFFGHPKSVVFDETYHGAFTSAYTTGNYFFDIHPPLARLLIKGFGDLAGVDYQSMNFSTIGNALTDDVLILRILPLIAGILLPLIIYYICRRLNFSEKLSFLAGFLICIENSLVVQSRFILFDSMLLLFGFGAILLYLKYVSDESKKYILLLSAVLATAAFSVKWTGLAFPLLIVVYELVRNESLNVWKYVKFVLVYMAIGIVMYFSIFAVHLSLLRNPGDGDAFMPGNFQEQGIVTRFIDLNIEMYRANANLTATHQYSSPWFTWPLLKRPVFYWQDMPAGQFIYLLGNPFIYWAGIISTIITGIILLAKIRRREDIDKTAFIILMGFIVNFLPFALIGRVMFIYHYQAALVFTILAIVYVISKVVGERRRNILSIGFATLCLASFIYFSPITYGLHLSMDQLMDRMWLISWR